jgi:transcription factor SPN1
MELDTTTLKECRLGPVVLLYAKMTKLDPAIRRQADALVQTWSRPIIRRPANFRSKFVETAEDVAVVPSQIEPRRKERFNIQKALKENEGRKMARLPVTKARLSVHGLILGSSIYCRTGTSSETRR